MKMNKLINPYKMYKFNIVMVIVNFVFAIGSSLIGLPSPFSHIFLASAACFIVGGLANWWIIRIIEDKSNKSSD